jgi:molybdopterin-containing oxidoreductase family iron-sulfur binding subunit
MAENLTTVKNTDPNLPTEQVGYWQSFEELYNDPEFVRIHQDEFKEGFSEQPETSGMSPISRRKFLALLGASAALAGTACSDYRDKGEIIPYNKKPEEVILGKPNYYASTCTLCKNACGILIKTREGRPIKIDGNPDHPVSKGKICAQSQASIMNLYDPDRLKNPKKKIDRRFIDYNWKDANNEIISDLMNAGKKEIALITHSIVSPTTKKVLDDFVSKYPTTKIYSYELFDNSVRNSAWKKCYGSGDFQAIKWNDANVILSLDGDFLGESNNKIENVRLFSEGRDVINKKFNRLYIVEGNLTITGMAADYRLRLRPDLQLNFLLSLIDALNKKGAGIVLKTSDNTLERFSKENNLNQENLNALVLDLLKNKGKSFIYAGDQLSEDVHIAVNSLNRSLGNEGLYNYESAVSNILPLSANEDLKTLSSKMKAGEVAVAIHLNSNPVYHLPLDLGYEEALSKVDTVISLVELENETSELSKFVLPTNNQLESWGDTKTRIGFYSLQQPVIAPLYDTRQVESIILTWISDDSSSYNESVYHNYLMSNWEKNIYSSLNSKLEFKRFWYGALHDGVVVSKEKSSSLGPFNDSIIAQIKATPASDNFTLHIKESYAVRDGRFANNGWLQELPHPVSKVVWDNYAAISTKTANDLGLKSNDLVEISNGKNSLKVPVFIQPGASDHLITIETGYGRKIGGTVGTGVGFNANILLNSNTGLSPWLYSNVKVEKVNDAYKLVTAQTVYAFNEGRTADLPRKRGIIKEGTVKEYLSNPAFIHTGEEHKDYSVNPPIQYNGLKWGMSIDMNRCLGCGECVVACNVENNIPVVGKEQVDHGREMHWIRIDRYYSGDPEDPKVNNQVMVCQQCDQAPCENVCPVAATSHSPDGLNQMVYNRCVGTRYCSNNCPYKVRRFNYFNFRDHFKNGYQETPVFALLQNPEVTVRSRGVMEKCTFCIQRISEARAQATREKRDLKGLDVKTACQEACSTNAINFGDINNKEEEFYTYRNHELGYYVLEELNVKPNVTYMAKLRNAHSEDV